MNGRVIFLAFAALLVSSTIALAQEDLRGRWNDNLTGLNALGPLTISKDRITVGRKITYQVKSIGVFGNGELFEVTGTNRNEDPICDTHFLVVERLPPIDPNVSSSPAIRVWFYSGKSAPTIESIDKDIGVCEIHPFSRPLRK